MSKTVVRRAGWAALRERENLFHKVAGITHIRRSQYSKAGEYLIHDSVRGSYILAATSESMRPDPWAIFAQMNIGPSNIALIDLNVSVADKYCLHSPHPGVRLKLGRNHHLASLSLPLKCQWRLCKFCHKCNDPETGSPYQPVILQD